MTNLNVTTNTTTTTISGDKLNKKLDEWIRHIETGDNNYFAFTISKGKLYYVGGKNATELITFRMLIDKGNGPEVTRVYTKDNTSSNTMPFILLVKKERKLIVNDNGYVMGFSIKDVEPSAKTLWIHAQTEKIHIFIAACEKGVEILHAVRIELNGDNPIAHCMNTIFTSISSQHPKEVV